MKKIVRLTESELINIIKRIINEQEQRQGLVDSPFYGCMVKTFPDKKFDKNTIGTKYKSCEGIVNIMLGYDERDIKNSVPPDVNPLTGKPFSYGGEIDGDNDNSITPDKEDFKEMKIDSLKPHCAKQLGVNLPKVNEFIDCVTDSFESESLPTDDEENGVG